MTVCTAVAALVTAGLGVAPGALTTTLLATATGVADSGDGDASARERCTLVTVLP